MAEAQQVEIDAPEDATTRAQRGGGGLYAEPITGKVAQLISERELVINRGFRNGVKVGMLFAVLADTPLEVRDPDSNEVLATIDQEKVRVKVSRVLERAAICKTYEFRIVGGTLFRLLTAAETSPLDLEPEQRVPVTLAVDNTSLPTPLPKQDRIVRPGDRVIQRLESEDLER